MFSFYKTFSFAIPRGAVRGVGGLVPSSSRTRRASLLFGVVLFALSSPANVDCWYDPVNDGWTCAGEGSTIFISAPTGGEFEGVVTTNGVGYCTNCLNMTSAEMVEFKERIGIVFDSLSADLGWIVSNSRSVSDDMYAFKRWVANIPYYSGSTLADRSNFVYNVAILYPSFDRLNLGDIVGSGTGYYSPSGPLQLTHWVGAWQSCRVLLSDLVDHNVDSWFNTTGAIYQKSDTGLRMVSAASDLVLALPTEPCVLSVDTNFPSGGDVGGNVVTNYGNWCTYEQGEALISALDKIGDWCDSAKGYLGSISNNLHSIDGILSRSLFSRYSHLPDVETFNLYGGWTNLYFQGSEAYPLEGYEPTNVLQRIELLLYGLSIGLNPTNEVSPESVSNTLNSVTNSVSSTFDGFAVSNDSFVAEMNTRGSSMLSTFSAFYNSFSSLSGESLSTSTQFIPDTSFSIGENSYTIPFVGPTSTATTANGVVATLRVFSACLWTIIGLWGCFWYWRSFLGRLIVWCRYAFDALRSAVS